MKYPFGRFSGSLIRQQYFDLLYITTVLCGLTLEIGLFYNGNWNSVPFNTDISIWCKKPLKHHC
jgi:hypothetical protein